MPSQHHPNRPGQPLNAADVSKILAHWAVGGQPTRIEDLGGGYNRNLHVLTPEDEVVIRMRQPWESRARLEDVHHLMERLQTEDIPIASPRPSRRGRTHSRAYRCLVEVYDYLPEVANRRWTPSRWRAGFAHMGRLHSALQRLSLTLTPPIVSNYARPELALRMLGYTRDRLNTLPPTPDVREGLAICQQAAIVMEKVVGYWRALAGRLPLQLIHGDFHLDNLLFGEDETVLYTLDFDFTGWRERIYELAYALRMALPQLTDNPAGVLDRGLVSAWLAAYDEESDRPLSHLERQALPYQMAHVALYFICEAGRWENALEVVLRESPYAELACHLVKYPEALVTA